MALLILAILFALAGIWFVLLGWLNIMRPTPQPPRLWHLEEPHRGTLEVRIQPHETAHAGTEVRWN